MDKIKVLFICVHNSARSQMAQPSPTTSTATCWKPAAPGSSPPP